MQRPLVAACLAVLCTSGTAFAHTGEDHGVHHMPLWFAGLAAAALVVGGIALSRRQQS